MTESFMSSSTSSQPNYTNPIFGLPSLLSSLPPATEAPRDYPFRMEDLMDWAPISGNPSLREDDPFILSPQRFPGPPTGLESLLAGTSLDAPHPALMNLGNRSRREPENGFVYWVKRNQTIVMTGLLGAALLLLAAVVVEGRWRSARWEAAWQWEKKERQWEAEMDPTFGFGEEALHEGPP